MQDNPLTLKEWLPAEASLAYTQHLLAHPGGGSLLAPRAELLPGHHMNPIPSVRRSRA